MAPKTPRQPLVVNHTKRLSARRRGYDGRWDKAIASFRQHHPWCLGCAALGKRKPTEVIDHVEPHGGDQAKFWNSALWQPACRWHHDVIKLRLERLFKQGKLKLADLWLNSPEAIDMSKRYPGRQRIGIDGWPLA